MFFIFFSFFLRKKFLLFFFLVFLSNMFHCWKLASEFNCFLRSRCSMEMWCPDDIGRDSWDWVGPLAWGREHASPLQSGVEAPRLLKTEPRQVGIIVVLDRLRRAASVYPQIAEMSWKREPSMTNNCGSSRARKKSSKKADSTSKRTDSEKGRQMRRKPTQTRSKNCR